jgi:hypothetical protein
MNPKTAAEISQLESLSVCQLAKRYEELFGDECRSRHKRYLVRRIAWRLQAAEEGGLSERAIRRAEELAVDSEIRVTAPREQHLANQRVATRQPDGFVDWDPRLPSPGNWLERRYKGRVIRVLLLADGFEYEGQRFRSLSSIAKAVTGSHVNGFLFFQLGAKA